MAEYKVTLYTPKSPVNPMDNEEDYAFLFEAMEREKEFCALCGCYNGHSLSCVKIDRKYVEHNNG